MVNSAIGAGWVGQVVDGKFTLLEWLGGDAGSGVFRTEFAQGPGLEKATIKIITAEGMEAESLLAGWAASVRLSHPHLMPVLFSGRCQIGYGAHVYVVTEYADEVLAQLLPERAMTAEEAMDMLVPILGALDYLHRNGFVHGHLKPTNILVVNDQLKLSGDGLHEAGKFRKSPSTLTVYDAPELAVSAVAPAADLWSLGALLHEALTQRPPAADTDFPQESGLPQPFAEIVRHCLSRKPSLRWGVADIKAHLDPTGSIPLPKGVEETPKTTSTFRIRFAVATAIGFLLAAAIVLLVLRPHETQPPAPAENSLPAADSSASSPAPSPAPIPAQGAAPQTSARPTSAPARSDAPAQVKSTSPSTLSPATGASALTPDRKSPQGPGSRGEVAQRVLPEVPSKSLATIQGKFESTVRVSVDAQGNVTGTSLQSPGPSRYFANFALQASRDWKFKPAQSGSQPVASVWSLRYTFRRSGPEVTAVEVSP